jgi:hypothetical protein
MPSFRLAIPSGSLGLCGAHHCLTLFTTKSGANPGPGHESGRGTTSWDRSPESSGATTPTTLGSVAPGSVLRLTIATPQPRRTCGMAASHGAASVAAPAQRHVVHHIDGTVLPRQSASVGVSSVCLWTISSITKCRMTGVARPWKSSASVASCSG